MKHRFTSEEIRERAALKRRLKELEPQAVLTPYYGGRRYLTIEGYMVTDGPRHAEGSTVLGFGYTARTALRNAIRKLERTRRALVVV